MEDFTGDFDFVFETDKLFEENDDIFGANDLLFNKETKQSPTTVQENSGPSSNSGRFAELENEHLDSILNRQYVIKHLYHGYPCYITFISHKNDVIIIVKLHRATRLRLVALYKDLTMIMTSFL